MDPCSIRDIDLLGCESAFESGVVFCGGRLAAVVLRRSGAKLIRPGRATPPSMASAVPDHPRLGPEAAAARRRLACASGTSDKQVSGNLGACQEEEGRRLSRSR